MRSPIPVMISGLMLISNIAHADELRERLIESHQTQIEVDEPEEDAMALLQGVEQDRPQVDDMTEEQMLRALMEAQGQK